MKKIKELEHLTGRETELVLWQLKRDPASVFKHLVVGGARLFLAKGKR